MGRDEWKPTQPYTERRIRRTVHRLRYYLRPHQRPRIRACGFAMAAPGGVGVALRPDGRAGYQGLATCGSVWECPVCSMVVKAKRAEEIGHVVERHGIERCVMLTLTFRHGLGDDLKLARAGLADAWRGFTRGEAWKRFKARVGLVGSIRALELTHGPNGWHPHLHILLLIHDDPEERAAIAGTDDPWAEHREWLSERWRSMVCRYLGDEHEPDDRHGVLLSSCRSETYLSKLGLELSDPGRKQARREGHRTPLEIANDLAETLATIRKHGPRAARTRAKQRDLALWRAYVDGMRGARQLTWTRGLKDAFGLRDRTDLEVAQDEEPTDGEAVVVGRIGGDDWQTIRARRVGGTPASYWILTEAEKGGGPGLRKAIAAVTSGRVGTVGT